MKILENQVADYSTANFSETETAWVSSPAVYTYGDEVRYGHYIYKYAGVTGTNTTDNPEDDVLLVSPSWVQISPSNYYAMLDGRTSTQTENADTIEVTVECDNFDAISLLGIEADEVSLSLYDNSTAAVVYTNTFDLTDESAITDFFSYCFEGFTLIPSLFTDDMPLYTDATLTIIIDNTGGIAKCGRLVLGRSYYIGDTLYGSNLSQESYSRKEIDEFGNETLVQRGSVNLDSYEIIVPSTKVPRLRRLGQDLDAVALLFIMDESEDSVFENLLNFGYWYDFNIVLPNSVKSTISLTIKGIL